MIMIKKIVLRVFILSCFISCSQNKRAIDIDKGKDINIAYNNLFKLNDKVKNEQIYFDVFPDNFKDFNSIFGYSFNDPNKIEKEGVLYYEAFNYIEAFFKLNFIEKEMFINKIIDISIDGKWFADGVNYFQHNMKIYLLNNLDSFCKILSLRNEKEIESFFIFYFDGIHTESLPKEFDGIKKTNIKLFKIIQKSYNLSLKIK